MPDCPVAWAIDKAMPAAAITSNEAIGFITVPR